MWNIAKVVIFALGAHLSMCHQLAHADWLGSAERAELIRRALHHPQVILSRNSEQDPFQVELCRCPFWMPYASFPKNLIDALIATEDRRFFSGLRINGNDPIAIGRAIASGGAQGASGINQQLLKNLLLGPERSLPRKIEEFWDAGYIEKEFSKEVAIWSYLNLMDFGTVRGRAVVGVEQAARVYFGKSVNNINLLESATLVGMLKAPNNYNPDRNPEKARNRALVVLKLMQGEKKITEADHLQAINQKYQRGPLGVLEVENRYYTDWVAYMINANHRGDLRGVLRIRAIIGLDSQLQYHGQSVVVTAITRNQGKGVSQGALVALDHEGLVRGVIGGRNYADSQFNRATSAKRQPGSTFKPIVFLSALQRGRAMSDRVLDEPQQGTWPRNFSGRFEGAVTLRHALVHSLNAATVRLGGAIGPDAVITTARQLGYTSDLSTTPSLPLGVYETTLLEMTGVYAAFANSGKRVTPHGIIALTTADGRQLNYRRPVQEIHTVEPKHANEIASALRGVVGSGTGVNANFGPRAAGKTGTTQEHRDAWFIGFDRDDKLVAGVWFGRDDGQAMQEVSGSSVPAVAWRQFMTLTNPERVPPPPERKVAKQSSRRPAGRP